MICLQTPEQATAWLRERVTTQLRTDSRFVEAGDGFIAWPGSTYDARQYVANALQAGATACLVEQAGASQYDFADERIATYVDLKQACGPIAADYFGHPSRELDVLAITGTNGKTTTAWWLAQALTYLGKRSGVMGTLGIGEPGGAMVSSGLTTPDPVLVQQELRRFVTQGYAACTLEASSIGLAEHRLDATAIDVAICTNFTQDHLDYHGSMQAYWEAKKRLFTWPHLKTAVINQDDATVSELLTTLASDIEIWTLSCRDSFDQARLSAKNIVHGPQGLEFDVLEASQRIHLAVPWVGHYNVSNLLGVIAALRGLGFDLEPSVQACTHLQAVPGRMQTIASSGQPLIVVDYAHTPDALEKVLQALQSVATERVGRLWCVFGCGGDRDPSKRPLMAAVAEAHADYVIVTSDNPRFENPHTIISQVLLGLSHRDGAQVQIDRAQAITEAITQAQPQDVVLLAGKGHETSQTIGKVQHPFSDLEQAQKALQQRQTQTC